MVERERGGGEGEDEREGEWRVGRRVWLRERGDGRERGWAEEYG